MKRFWVIDFVCDELWGLFEAYLDNLPTSDEARRAAVFTCVLQSNTDLQLLLDDSLLLAEAVFLEYGQEPVLTLTPCASEALRWNRRVVKNLKGAENGKC